MTLDLHDPQVYKIAAQIRNALKECSDELRAEAENLLDQLNSGQLTPDEEAATAPLLMEILFPNADEGGAPGLDLVEAEGIAKDKFPHTISELEQLDHEEATFAQRLRLHMDRAGLTQAELADRIGIGQPAISMMLNRTCRPQKNTVRRLAEALGIVAEDLWPSRNTKPTHP